MSKIEESVLDWEDDIDLNAPGVDLSDMKDRSWLEALPSSNVTLILCPEEVLGDVIVSVRKAFESDERGKHTTIQMPPAETKTTRSWLKWASSSVEAANKNGLQLIFVVPLPLGVTFSHPLSLMADRVVYMREEEGKCRFSTLKVAQGKIGFPLGMLTFLK